MPHPEPLQDLTPVAETSQPRPRHIVAKTDGLRDMGMGRQELKAEPSP